MASGELSIDISLLGLVQVKAKKKPRRTGDTGLNVFRHVRDEHSDMCPGGILKS